MSFPKIAPVSADGKHFVKNFTSPQSKGSLQSQHFSDEEAKRVNLPAGFHASLAERGEETLPASVTEEDGLAVVATIHHMIDGTFVFNASFANHASAL